MDNRESKRIRVDEKLNEPKYLFLPDPEGDLRLKEIKKVITLTN